MDKLQAAIEKLRTLAVVVDEISRDLRDHSGGVRKAGVTFEETAGSPRLSVPNAGDVESAKLAIVQRAIRILTEWAIEGAIDKRLEAVEREAIVTAVLPSSDDRARDDKTDAAYWIVQAQLAFNCRYAMHEWTSRLDGALRTARARIERLRKSGEKWRAEDLARKVANEEIRTSGTVNYGGLFEAAKRLLEKVKWCEPEIEGDCGVAISLTDRDFDLLGYWVGANEAAAATVRAVAEGEEVDQRSRGLYPKFRVERLDGRDLWDGDRADADYFVLDLDYDDPRSVIPAIKQYARGCAEKYPALSQDLLRKVHAIKTDWDDTQAAAAEAMGYTHDGGSCDRDCPVCFPGGKFDYVESGCSSFAELFAYDVDPAVGPTTEEQQSRADAEDVEENQDPPGYDAPRPGE